MKTMYKRVSVVLVVLLLVVSGLFANGNAEAMDEVAKIRQAGVLKVGVKVDVPHFGYKNISTGEIEGFEIDLAKAVAKEILGDESKISFTPVTAKTRGPLLDTGELNMVAATFTVTEERKLSYEFSTIYYTDAVSLMVKKSSGIKSFKDLDGKTIGVAQSATTKKALEAAAAEAGITLKFNEFASYPEIKVALDSNRVQSFSVDRAILLGYVEDSTEILPDRFSPQEYGIAIKKGNTALLQVVNDTIVKLEGNGELAAMKAKWGLDK